LKTKVTGLKPLGNLLDTEPDNMPE